MPKDQVEGQNWRKVRVQTFFTETAHRQYFEVCNNLSPSVNAEIEELDNGHQAFICSLVDDELSFEPRIGIESGVVGGFDVHKSEAIPWLDWTGIECHLRGLPMTQILASYRLPRAGDQSLDSMLTLILEATEVILTSAHKVALPGADSKLSWPSMLVLNKFSTNGGKPSAFLVKKSVSSLKTYFGYWMSRVRRSRAGTPPTRRRQEAAKV